ncbi:MAG: agmatinase family protein [Bacteroidota bacterium]
MQSKKEVIEAFDPNAPAISDTLFGLPFNEDHSDLILIPAPWEVTVSYGSGAANGPQAILDASGQVDLHLPHIKDAWTMGMHLLVISKELKEENDIHRDLASKYIKWLENSQGDPIPDELKIIPNAVNEVCEKLNIYIKSQSLKYLGRNKVVGLIGGDHSTPLGLINAVTEHFGRTGILQIDAHADLRRSYADFTYSHASIMYNALKNPKIDKLVQVGVRDFCKEESTFIENSKGRVVTFLDQNVKRDLYHGHSWVDICEKIVAELPKQVYLSIDIDGLDPKLCPNTGTPVPGGLEFFELIHLVETVVRSGRKIVGFDISEVAPGKDEWDANVGAWLLYNVGSLVGVSNGKLVLKA